MIAQLTGTIVRHDTRFVVLDVHGVGYKVFVTSDFFNKLSPLLQKEVTLVTYMVVREDALDLYGFLTESELSFFELLISISGIGPKTALGILNVASVHTLQTAIATGDTTHLTKVSGIGKKNAEKIVLELKDKIDTISGLEHGEAMKNESDALEALTSLGYKEHEAREALKKIDKTISDTSGKIKAALKLLGK